MKTNWLCSKSKKKKLNNCNYNINQILIRFISNYRQLAKVTSGQHSSVEMKKMLQNKAKDLDRYNQQRQQQKDSCAVDLDDIIAKLDILNNTK